MNNFIFCAAIVGILWFFGIINLAITFVGEAMIGMASLATLAGSWIAIVGGFFLLIIIVIGILKG